jgi:hypothetical protein
MTINKATIRELEQTHRWLLSDDLKRYLLVKYAEEPFPDEFSEQDLYLNILHDIQSYEIGQLDTTVKSPKERWHEEREHLQSLYIEKSCELRNLKEYVAELEQLLLDHGLESSRMVKRRTEVLG